MKTLLAAPLLALTLAAPSLAFAGTSEWEIDGAHTMAQFSVKYMMVTNVRGGFGKVTGGLTLDEKDVTKSKVQATIDATTIDTDNEKRDGHLKSEDFFHVEKYPTIAFVSSKVTKAGKGKLKVHGDLTMRGVTKPVVLDVEWPEVEVPAGESAKRGASATTTINRKDFGVSWNKAVDGGVLVSDEVKIQLDLTFDRKAAEKKQAAKK